MPGHGGHVRDFTFNTLYRLTLGNYQVVKVSIFQANQPQVEGCIHLLFVFVVSTVKNFCGFAKNCKYTKVILFWVSLGGTCTLSHGLPPLQIILT